MPIIETVPVDAALNQGDILNGVRLFSTAECWKEDGGEAVIANYPYCLIVSRPCVANHKEHVTVVPVGPYTDGISEKVKTFEDVVQFLKDTRDGTDSPDVFYLGEIPGRKGRYAARLDSFHNVNMPSHPQERATFLQDHRIARLSIDFARDLHLRLFRSFASLGFDDTGWLGNQDLQWVIDKGRVDVAEAEKDWHEKQVAKAQKEFGGQQFSEKALQTAQATLVAAKAALAPYEKELAKREAASHLGDQPPDSGTAATS